jgi:diguanylate cyclase (GGDEF)-like protein/PAS domain S-box-containing protein
MAKAEFRAIEQRRAVRILLVEDDPICAGLVRMFLEQPAWAAISLEWVETLAAALARLRNEIFELVILDLNLPDSRGLATLDGVISAGDRLIIVLTGSEDPGLREASIRGGAYDLLHKNQLEPVALERLVRLASMQANTFRSLRGSEERFRSLTELSADWYWEQDAEFRLTFMSRRLGEKTGLDPSAYLGYKRWDQPALNLTEADWQRHRAQLDRHEPFHDFEMQRPADSGGSVWLSLSGEPVFDAGGRFAGYRGIGRDITERKRAEQELRQSEERFRSLTQLSADVFWEQDEQNRFTSFIVNSASTLDGVGSQALIGKRRWELDYANMTAADWAAHRTLIDSRRPFHDLELCRLVDGRELWVSTSGEPVFGAGGAFNGYRGVGKDITARKREEALLQLEHSVTRCLAQAESAASAMREVIRELCQTERWECGRYFRVDEKAGVMRFAEAWGVSDPQIAHYIEKSRDVTYAMGMGLTGKVWQTGEPLWVSDRGVHADVSQSVFGQVRDVFIFPLRSGSETLGILTFISRRLRPPDARLLQAVRVIGSQVGQFLQRKRAEGRQEVHLRYQEKTARFGHSALGKRDPAELIDDAVQNLLQALGAGAVAYFERGPGQAELITRALVGLADPHAGSGEIVCPADDPVLQVLNSGERCLTSGARLSPSWAQGLHSAALIPVRGEQGARGALCAFYERAEVFPAEELNYIEATASVLSTGLQRIDSESRLAYLAQFDPLTGLPNRALLADRFSQMIEQAKRRGSLLGVLFIDLDQFKLVNDSLGHAGGDELLKEAARRLQASVRAGDTVARISGDEFAVVLADLSHPEDAAIVAQKIIEQLGAVVEIGGQEVFLTASIGIAEFPADGGDVEALLSAADAAMYRAKQSGRNAYHFFTAELTQRTRARAQIGTELRRALEREEFTLVYQPKFDLRSGAACGAEALLRWTYPERGPVSPVDFVPVLEETGLIVPVGDWVLQRACADLVAWSRAGRRALPVAVNLSARQFRLQDLDRRIIALVRAAGVDASLIELEITESQLMHDPDHAIRVMRALRDGGINTALDDFGTGYSSLAYLTRFPLASLKIDRSFIMSIHKNVDAMTLVSTIISLAQSLRLKVVAEGVETEQQATYLRLLRCDQVQGFFFARPMPAADFQALLPAAAAG